MKDKLKQLWAWYKGLNYLVKWLIPIFILAVPATFYKPLAYAMVGVILAAIAYAGYVAFKGHE